MSSLTCGLQDSHTCRMRATWRFCSRILLRTCSELAKTVDPKRSPHTRNWLLREAEDVSVNLTVAGVSTCVLMFDHLVVYFKHHIVELKHTQFLFVNEP